VPSSALGPNRSLVRVFHAASEQKAGLFERGKLEIAGLGTFRALGSSAKTSVNGNTITTLDVDASIGANAMDRDAKIYDDDDQYLSNDPLYSSLLNLQSPPLPALPEVPFFLSAAQPHFAAAYITLVNANVMGWNTVPNVAFKRHEPPLSIGGGVVFDSGNLQLKGTDRSTFWAFSVVFGYQAAFPDDGEPDRETSLSGGTPKTSPFLIGGANRPFGYSVIFMEAIREHAFTPGLNSGSILPANFADASWTIFLRSRYLHTLYGTIAHEISHAPGRQSEKSDHVEEGMMTAGAPTITETTFLPQTVRRFRQAVSWTQ